VIRDGKLVTLWMIEVYILNWLFCNWCRSEKNGVTVYVCCYVSMYSIQKHIIWSV